MLAALVPRPRQRSASGTSPASSPARTRRPLLLWALAVLLAAAGLAARPSVGGAATTKAAWANHHGQLSASARIACCSETGAGSTHAGSCSFVSDDSTSSWLRYLIGRYYDPATGQFLTLDPVIDETEAPYAYASGDPVDNDDPDGLASPEMPDGDPFVIDVISWGDFVRGMTRGSYVEPEAAGIPPPAQPCLFGQVEELFDDAAEEEAGLIYRTGSQTPNALTDASGVSFRDSISSSADRVQVFRRGDKIWAVDTSRLPPGSVVRDGVPPGHVTVNATPAQIRSAIVDDPALRDLGLKRLDDGSYRLPK